MPGRRRKTPPINFVRSRVLTAADPDCRQLALFGQVVLALLATPSTPSTMTPTTTGALSPWPRRAALNGYNPKQASDRTSPMARRTTGTPPDGRFHYIRDGSANDGRTLPTSETIDA
jgi:hypothetical protein